jgi:hypothetical protein
MSQRKKERLLKGILEGCKVETVDPFQCQCHRFWVVAVGSRVVGDRTADDEVTYPEIDLELKQGLMSPRVSVTRMARLIRARPALNPWPRPGAFSLLTAESGPELEYQRVCFDGECWGSSRPRVNVAQTT